MKYALTIERNDDQSYLILDVIVRSGRTVDAAAKAAWALRDGTKWEVQSWTEKATHARELTGGTIIFEPDEAEVSLRFQANANDPAPRWWYGIRVHNAQSSATAQGLRELTALIGALAKHAPPDAFDGPKTADIVQRLLADPRCAGLLRYADRVHCCLKADSGPAREELEEKTVLAGPGNASILDNSTRAGDEPISCRALLRVAL